MLFIIHHTPVTAKGGCLWQQNNGNAKIKISWWNILLMATPVCAESNVNTAARSSTPRPETANIAASRPAVTRCWICGKALKSVPSAERIPALAAGSSSCRSGQMPDIAAMPVGRKTTASVKQPYTLLFEGLLQNKRPNFQTIQRNNSGCIFLKLKQVQHFFSKTKNFWWRCDALAFCIAWFYDCFLLCLGRLCCIILQQPLICARFYQ